MFILFLGFFKSYISSSTFVVYWPLTEPTIKRRPCVNKRKKKRKQVNVLKKYRQVPELVELVGDRKAKVRANLQTEGCGPQGTPVEQPQPRCGRSAKWVLEDNTAGLGQENSLVNIAVCPCLHTSLTHKRNINPLENKVWEIYIFMKNCVRSFIEVHHYLWLCSCLYLYLYVAIKHIKDSYFPDQLRLLNKLTASQQRG